MNYRHAWQYEVNIKYWLWAGTQGEGNKRMPYLQFMILPAISHKMRKTSPVKFTENISNIKHTHNTYYIVNEYLFYH